MAPIERRFQHLPSGAGVRGLHARAQATVSAAKNTVIVRSLEVPTANAASNVLQLKTLGVPFSAMGRGFVRKLAEVARFQKNRKREMQIAALLGGTNDLARHRRLETELRAIEDANKRMSIAPLIEEGELSTISEGLTEADGALVTRPKEPL